MEIHPRFNENVLIHFEDDYYSGLFGKMYQFGKNFKQQGYFGNFTDQSVVGFNSIGSPKLIEWYRICVSLLRFLFATLVTISTATSGLPLHGWRWMDIWSI